MTLTMILVISIIVSMVITRWISCNSYSNHSTDFGVIGLIGMKTLSSKTKCRFLHLELDLLTLLTRYEQEFDQFAYLKYYFMSIIIKTSNIIVINELIFHETDINSVVMKLLSGLYFFFCIGCDVLLVSYLMYLCIYIYIYVHFWLTGWIEIVLTNQSRQNSDQALFFWSSSFLQIIVVE